MMDLPVGMLVKEGMETIRVDLRKLFSTLSVHNFTGYVAVDIMTNNGIEEGTLLLRNGEIIAAEYEYLARGCVVRGEEAMKLTVNACAGDGNFDIYELGDEESVRVREGNQESVLKDKPTLNDVLAILPETFVENTFETRPIVIRQEAIKLAGGVSKDEVLKKYGISHPSDKALDKMLKGLIEG